MTIDPRHSNPEIADDLATRVNRLGSRSLACDVEKFLADRDEIARDLRNFAKRLRGDCPKTPLTVWRP